MGCPSVTKETTHIFILQRNTPKMCEAVYMHRSVPFLIRWIRIIRLLVIHFDFMRASARVVSTVQRKDTASGKGATGTVCLVVPFSVPVCLVVAFSANLLDCRCSQQK